MRGSRRHMRNSSSIRAFAVLFTLALLPGGCFGETFQRGYVLPDGALEQIPLGASQEQVLLVLGTPSTVATLKWLQRKATFFGPSDCSWSKSSIVAGYFFSNFCRRGG